MGSIITQCANLHLNRPSFRGKGLGKNEDGIKTHVRVAKKEEAEGIGFKASSATPAWSMPLLGNGGLAPGRIGGDAAVTLSSSDSDDSDADGAARRAAGSKRRRSPGGGASALPSVFGEAAAPTFEELFAATGGARLGMRARADQPGKIARAEKHARALAARQQQEAAARASVAPSDASAGEAEGGAGEEVDRRAAKAARRAAREEKRRAKEARRAARAAAAATAVAAAAAAAASEAELPGPLTRSRSHSVASAASAGSGSGGRSGDAVRQAAAGKTAEKRQKKKRAAQ